MDLLRRLRASRHVRRLLSGEADDTARLEESRQHVLQSGASGVRALLNAVARGASPDRAVELLAQLATNAHLPTFLEYLRSPQGPVVDAVSAALSRSTSYEPTRLLALFSDPQVPRGRLEAILTAQGPHLQAASLLREVPGLDREARPAVMRIVEKIVDAGAIEEASRLSGHPDLALRQRIARLLGRFANPVGAEALVRMLRDEQAAVRLEAVRALGRLQWAPAIPALCTRLRDSDIKVQAAAIDTLVGIGDVAAVPHLIEHLKDDSEYVRRAAVEVLNEVVTVDAIKDLVKALRDSDWWVRVRAADALGTLGGSRVIEAVSALVHDEDDFIRRYAVEILNMVPDRRAVDALLVALDDHDWWVRERAIDALAKTGDSRAVEPLLHVLARDPRAVVLCVRALGGIPDARAVEPLSRLLDAEAPEVRREALAALSHYAEAKLPAAWHERVVQAIKHAQLGTGEPATATAHAAAPPAARTSAAPPVPAPAMVPAPAPSTPSPDGPRPRAAEREINFQRLDSGAIVAGRYRVLQCIGGGGFGTVYLVEDDVVGEELVLKVLSPRFSSDEAAVRRFVQELRLTRRITHKNVIRIHDLLELPGAHAISMEYFAGRDLGAVLRESGPMPVDRVRRIATQVLEGLVAAHATGILHRDIKPGNVLVGADDEVKIVDFGLASMSERGEARLTTDGALVGTPEYIAPEQITGQPLDGRTDLYSFAVVLYELLTGRQPFHGPNPVNVLFQHLEPEIPGIRTIAPHVPEPLEALVMRCMSRFPDDRPAGAQAMLDELALVP